MFNWFFEEIILTIVEAIEDKHKRTANVIHSTASYVFLTAMTGGLWPIVDILGRSRKKRKKRRKNKKRA